MNVNPHLYACKNYGYQSGKAALGGGVNLKTNRAFVEDGFPATGEELYYKYLEECNDLFKSFAINEDFWLRINEKVYIKENVDYEFYGSNYTLFELLSIINEISFTRGYKREACEKYMFQACQRTIESRINSLQNTLCAIECRKFLVKETEFIWDSWHDL